MKKSIYLLLSLVLIAVITFSCNTSTPKDSEAIEARGYYLHEGKMCLHDFSNDSVTVLDITDKKIVEFELSPTQDYVACLIEKLKSDCRTFNALLVYDLNKNEVLAELGTGEYVNVYFEGWKSDNKFAYIQAETTEDEFLESGIAHQCSYTVGEGNVCAQEEYDLNLYWENYEEPEKELPPSKNEDISLSVQEDGIYMMNNKKKEEKIIAIPATEVLSGLPEEVYLDEKMIESGSVAVDYEVNAWLNSESFLFTTTFTLLIGQCDNYVYYLYRYNINSGKEELISKDAAFLRMID